MSDILKRLKDRGVSCKCNDNISAYLDEYDYGEIHHDVEAAVQNLLNALVIDTENDHNTNGSAARLTKMFIEEIFSGRYDRAPKITSFPNVMKFDQLYVAGPITVRSMCAHHFMPIKGKAYVGVFPGTNVIGLSKFNRIVDHIASRPQIQEEMTVQIAAEIEAQTKATGVAVLIQAEHFCMTHRGVKEHESDMTTSVVLGKLRGDPSLKQEFFSIIGRMK